MALHLELSAGGLTQMPQLLGDRLLPDTVVERRNQFRERVMELRRPIRDARERMLPGPDLVGNAEDRLTDLRNRVVSRQSVVGRIRQRRSDSGGNSSSNGNGSGSSESGQVNTSQMT